MPKPKYVKLSLKTKREITAEWIEDLLLREGARAKTPEGLADLKRKYTRDIENLWRDRVKEEPD